MSNNIPVLQKYSVNVQVEPDTKTDDNAIFENDKEEDNKIILEQFIDQEGKIWDRNDKAILKNESIDHNESNPEPNTIVDLTDDQTKAFQCNCCAFATSRKVYLRRHFDKVHLKIRRYGCIHCDYKAPKKFTLEQHVRAVHLKIRQHKCSLCDYSAAYKVILKGHVDKHHLKIAKQCHLCSYSSAFSHSLRSHIENVHMKLKNYKCDRCDYVAYEKSRIAEHIRNTHEKVKTEKCQFCDYACCKTQRTYLKKHIEVVHFNVKNFQCDLCDYRSSLEGSLRTHVEMTHLNFKNEKCEICDFATNSKSKLKAHVDTVHVRKQNHVCCFCEYTASRSDYLQKHVNAVHFMSKPFKCHLCQMSLLDKDVQNHAPQSLPNNMCKKCKSPNLKSGVKCQICGLRMHTSCANILKVQFINEKEIICCKLDDNQAAADNLDESISSVNSFTSAGNNTIVNNDNLEINYLKQLIEQKDMVIDSLQSELNAWKEQVNLLKYIHKVTSTSPSASKSNQRIDIMQNSLTQLEKHGTTESLTSSTSPCNETETFVPSHCSSAQPQNDPSQLKQTGVNKNITKQHRQRQNQNLTCKESPNTNENIGSTENTKSVNTNKNNRRHSGIIGTNEEATTSNFKGVEIERKVWLHVSRLKPDLLKHELKECLERKYRGYTFICEKIEPKHIEKPSFSSFKVGVNVLLEKQLLDPINWPKNVLIQKYFFRSTRRQHDTSNQ